LHDKRGRALVVKNVAGGAPVNAAAALISTSQPSPGSARPANSRCCPDPECQAYRAMTSDGFCERCGTTTVATPIVSTKHAAMTALRNGPRPAMVSPSSQLAGALPRRRRYSNARRISYAGLWAF
jgi:hypothetical protein